MSSYISERVLCPFYKDARCDRQSIMCEGVELNTAIHLTFPNKLKRKAYMEKYCCLNYDSCNIAEMLYKKYEEEEKKEYE